MNTVGFKDVRTIGYPQTTYPSGWWSATLARKQMLIDGFREAEVDPDKLSTNYYTADIHKAAFAMPAFFLRRIENENG